MYELKKSQKRFDEIFDAFTKNNDLWKLKHGFWFSVEATHILLVLLMIL